MEKSFTNMVGFLAISKSLLHEILELACPGKFFYVISLKSFHQISVCA